jgi:hypothetical protein
VSKPPKFDRKQGFV